MRVLVVEDEVRLAEALETILLEHRYAVDLAFDGQTGLEHALTGIYDVIVLDVMLPRMDGLRVVHALRAQGVPTPILLLTARDEVPDRVAGLDSGADYYMTKPFDPRELLACIRALSRRQPEIAPTQYLEFHDLSLDLSLCVLTCARRSVRLGHKECELMRLLMHTPRRTVLKELLLLKVWGMQAEDNSAEVYISFLRKKLFYLGSEVTIVNVRKVGYYLEAPP